MSEFEHDGGEEQVGRLSASVKVQMLKDGIYTWAIFNPSGATIDELRTLKDDAVAICRELEEELPHGPVPEPTPSHRKRY